jgi:hypothetical protein
MHSGTAKQGLAGFHFECADEQDVCQSSFKMQRRDKTTLNDTSRSRGLEPCPDRAAENRDRKSDKRQDKESIANAKFGSAKGGRRKKREKQRKQRRSGDGGRSESENESSKSRCKMRGPPDWLPDFAVSSFDPEFQVTTALARRRKRESAKRCGK